MSDNRLRIVAVLTIVGTVLAGARADDGPMGQGAGGTIQLLGDHPSVRMVSEDVLITPAKWEVRARFFFRNEGKAVKVLMGFPEDVRKGDKTPFAFFETTVDGRIVPTRRVLAKNRDTGGWMIYWRAKEVPFSTNQTRIVVVRYRVIPDAFRSDSSGYDWGYLHYTLHTGAGWKGAIGRVRVVCDLAGVTHGKFSPKPTRVDKTKAVWVYRDLEPQERHDVNATWLEGFPGVVLDGHRVWPIYRKPTDPSNSGRWFVGRRNPIRRGDEVWVPVKTVCAWLNAEFDVRPGRMRVSRFDRWVEFTVGSKCAASDRGALLLPGSVDDDQGSTIVPLMAVARALGARARWDAEKEHLLLDNR